MGNTGLGLLKRGRLAIALLVALGAVGAAVPASSGAAVAVGIADSEPSTFDSPLWAGQNVVRLRVIVPYDIATRPATDPRRKEFEEWLSKFNAFRVTHSEATINVGFERINIKEPERPGFGHAPDEATYRAAFKAFVTAYSSYLTYMRIDPWNEPNFNPGNGSRALLPGGVYYLDEAGGGCDTETPFVSNCGPRMAAYYYRWAQTECPTCYLEAGEFAGTTGYDYIQKYKRHLGTFRPDVWGVHNYSDVASFQVSGSHDAVELKNMLGELFCTETSTSGVSLGSQHCNSYSNWKSGEVWVTATAAVYSFRCSEHPTISCPAGSNHKVYGETSQCNAAAYMLRWGNIDSRINRVYHYTYMDVSSFNLDGGDDSGLVSGDGLTARKAYYVFRDRNESESCPY
jgi:hypothetical protein